MKIQLILFIFYLIHAPLSIAQVSDNSLLWRVSGPGITHDVYLFGTMHLLPQEDFYFPKRLQKFVRKSDELVLEIAEIDPTQALPYLQLQSGNVLDPFSEEQTDTILDWFKRNMYLDSLSFQAFFGSFKPFVLLQTASSREVGTNPASYEQSLTELAQENNIPITGLETVAFQIGLFDKLPADKMAALVMESFREDEQQKRSYEELMTAYKNQDIDKIHQLIIESPGQMQSLTKEMLYDRNNKWVPQIIQLAKTKHTFIAIGAGHLGGTEGVLQLLRDAGYAVGPVLY